MRDSQIIRNLLYLSLIYFAFTFGISSAQQNPYSDQHDIALDCGFQGNHRARDSRSWTGDIKFKLFPLKFGQNNASITSIAIDQTLTGADPVPYGTARLSLSDFTYTIPVTPGPKFVRLHFYSAKYDNFNISKAIFSVKAGQYTLLSNFSVFQTAKALKRKDVVKEYCVTVAKSSLKITFTPSSSISEAFALVNGIEVVSMPLDLYYSEDRGFGGIKLLGQNAFYSFSNHTALETMYRVDIGGSEIRSTDEDTTTFFRKWEGLGSEELYLTEPGSSVLEPGNSINLSFTAIPKYIAPEAVYRTARSMGTDREINKKYNLTWEFEVDSGFQYMVRLHFCEISIEMNSTGDRIFLIYIANQTAEDLADVIFWSGGKYVPYYRDYAVSMFKPGEKKLNLSIALQAIPGGYISRYSDAILNGVEIFKLSDTSGNLAISNFDTFQPSEQQIRKPENKRRAIIGISSGVVCVVVLLCMIGFFILRQGRKVKDSTKFEKTQGSSLSSDLCRYFSLAEIRAATNNFEDIFIIGVGGFGNVYKGHIDGGTTAVAIKRLKPGSSQGAHEFKTEIEMLSHLRHRNLVSLIGYCNENHEMILVYEYMPRGTLSNHLYNTDNPPLLWKQRLQICIGAASGLHYLHAGVQHITIHRDVKTTNILLDEKWVAKVSDFGLSKMGPSSSSTTHVSTMVKGSFGYLDPEYYRLQHLTEKSDVYSFGVVLCEVLCGRPPIMRTVERSQMSLAEWVRGCHQNGTLDEIMDPYLTGKIASGCLKKYGEIAVSCMLDNGAERPSMKEVVSSLELALQLQMKEEEDISLCEEPAKSNSSGKMGVGCSWEDPSGAIFSDINDLQAR